MAEKKTEVVITITTGSEDGTTHLNSEIPLDANPLFIAGELQLIATSITNQVNKRLLELDFDSKKAEEEFLSKLTMKDLSTKRVIAND